MSAILRTRMSGQSTDTFTGGVSQGIVLARDVVDLNLNLRTSGAAVYQQVILSQELATVTGVTLDLNDASNTWLDAGGSPIRFAKIFWLLLAVVEPGAAKALRYGPMGVANSAQLWFSGVTADEWVLVTDADLKLNRSAGWAVDTANANLRIYNPSAGSVTFRLWIVGEKP